MTTSVIMLLGNMSLTTELLTLASTAHALTCATVRADISVARFAFAATASRLYTGNQTVASQTLAVSLSILLCTFNHTGHAILMCLLQLTVSLAKSVWRHCLANSFVPRLYVNAHNKKQRGRLWVAILTGGPSKTCIVQHLQCAIIPA